MNNASFLGRSIKLFLTDGTTNGIMSAEIMNWVGHILFIPRGKLQDFFKREESERSGCYLLIGEDTEDSSKNAVYIGESENPGKRFKSHHQDKDFWDRIIFISSKDAHLTKGHIKFIESKLIQLATKSQRYTVLNTQSPEGVKLPEADRADMGYFLQQIQFILPVLGFDVIQPNVTEQIERSKIDAAHTFHIDLPKRDVKGKMVEIDGEFVILEGSQAKRTPSGSFNKKNAVDALLADGSLEDTGKHLIFTRDVPFKSLSTSATILCGYSCNGWEFWKLPDGRSYSDWKAEEA